MEIFIEIANEEDYEGFYNLKIDKNNVFWSGFKKPPKKKKLNEWFLKQLSRQDRIIFLVRLNDNPKKPVGYLYLDFLEDDIDSISVSYGVHSDFMGKGIGTKIIAHAFEYVRANYTTTKLLVGWVSTKNIASMKVFKKNNFIETNETKKVLLVDFNEEITMIKYIKNINH
ncbi:hypothetical protein NEF87_004339 [Candidatus Lokiarchaeum ossiferum]|uniref:N-acetyltransferase domain-containing protein n=1 Tax=Candidatus Lokiarchaeum ossiferum TaxID=2951803 RepID=A0ABY6HWZ6_9ARCH|nr:hypothetical protein NEF87_004339 [Candidatus Lokiarchaeum sp. B-35]